jgi:hypothetical protein
MSCLILRKNLSKVLVIGPIYDKLEKLKRAGNLIENYDLTIFNGSLCYPNDDLDQVEQRIELMNEFLKTGKVVYNLSNYDLELSHLLYEKKQGPKIQYWLQDKPNVVIIEFKNQSNCIITSGGMNPKFNRESLLDNIETSFISNINGVPWHKTYSGLYGYVISNNPLTDKEPQFHSYSAQIGNVYNSETQVYAQEVEPFGLKRTILL